MIIQKIELIKMKTNLVLWTILMSVFLSSCGNENENEADKIILATVGNNTLYYEDMKRIIPMELSSPDSALHAQNYVQTWVKKQLLLKKADLNLTAEQKNVSQQLEEYRIGLLLYKYQSQYVAEKMDTIISETSIINYYNEFKDNFKLRQMVLKGLFIKVANDIPDAENIRYLIRSKREADSIDLAEYCLQYASKYDNFANQWVYFNTLQSQWPKLISNPENTIRFNNVLIEKDSLFTYYVRIDDYRLNGDYSPLSLEREKIKNIILNRRKIDIVSNLEKEIYNEALNTNGFTIYEMENK